MYDRSCVTFLSNWGYVNVNSWGCVGIMSGWQCVNVADDYSRDWDDGASD